MKKFILVLLMFSILTGCGKEKIKIINETTDKYAALIQTNSPIKLNYSIKCTEYSDKSIKCEDPIVDEYELVNDKSKTLFKDIDLLESNNDLYTVIKYICEKSLEKNSIKIETNWEEINKYLENKDYSFDIEIKEIEDVKNEIDEEEEKRRKKEEEEKAKIESTIKLNDNVEYCQVIFTYTCINCFSPTLIDIIKLSKGYSVSKANSKEITFKRITNLSGIYGNKKYYGDDITNRILAAGGQEVNSSGSCNNKLTSNICKQFNLICE